MYVTFSKLYGIHLCTRCNGVLPYNAPLLEHPTSTEFLTRNESPSCNVLLPIHPTPAVFLQLLYSLPMSVFRYCGISPLQCVHRDSSPTPTIAPLLQQPTPTVTLRPLICFSSLRLSNCISSRWYGFCCYDATVDGDFCGKCTM